MKLKNKFILCLFMCYELIGCTIHNEYAYRQNNEVRVNEINIVPFIGVLANYSIVSKNHKIIKYTTITDSLHDINLSNADNVIFSSFSHNEYYVPNWGDESSLYIAYTDLFDTFRPPINMYEAVVFTETERVRDIFSQSSQKEQYLLSDSTQVYREYVSFYGLLLVDDKYISDTISSSIEAWRYHAKRACIPLTFNVIVTTL